MNPRPLVLLPYPGSYALQEARRVHRRSRKWPLMFWAVLLSGMSLVWRFESKLAPEPQGALLRAQFVDTRNATRNNHNRSEQPKAIQPTVQLVSLGRN